MGAYLLLNQIEQDRKSVVEVRNQLQIRESDLEKLKEGITEAVEVTTKISRDLIEVEAELLRGKMKYHRLENFWDDKRIGQFRRVSELLDFPQQKDIKYFNTCFNGRVYRKKKTLVVISDFKRSVIDGLCTSASIFGFFMLPGLYLLAKNKTPELFYTWSIVSGGLSLVTALGVRQDILKEGQKNPFSYVSENLQERAKYVSERLKE